MSFLPLNPPSRPVSGWRPFALGFRPFFLLAGLGAVTLMLLWLLSWHKGILPEAYYGRVGWHTHEMLFGFASAVIAGFLLTAVRNWTGHPTPTGAPLAALALLWLTGRLLPWLPGMAPELTAAVDLAFLPLLAIALAPALWAGANRVNRWFLPLLGTMAAANGLIHAEALGWASGTGARGSGLMLDLILLTLLWVGGRVMPFFTERAVAGTSPKMWKPVERSIFGVVLAVCALDLAGIRGWPTAAAALALGVVQGLRLYGWYDRRVWGIPILWVLYTGFAWLTLGLVLRALAELGLFPGSMAIHALTAGGIGVTTLGMMSRVALGHTGREMRSSTPIDIAFAAANLAAAVRVFGPYFVPPWYVGWILLSGLLWTLAFGTFAFVYTPILVRPRIDGREG